MGTEREEGRRKKGKGETKEGQQGQDTEGTERREDFSGAGWSVRALDTEERRGKEVDVGERTGSALLLLVAHKDKDTHKKEILYKRNDEEEVSTTKSKECCHPSPFFLSFFAPATDEGVLQ